MENKVNNSYAWWIVFAGFMLMFSTIGILVNCNSVFFKPIIENMGFSRASFSLTFTIISLAAMIAAPFMGKFLTKYNARLLMGISLLMCSLCFAGYSLCQTLPQFYILSIFVGVGMAGISVIPVSMMITNWFAEKRGLAIGLAFTGSGIGGMLLNPLTNWLIINYGWQAAYQVLGAIMLFTLAPIILFIVSIVPAEKGLLPYGLTAEQEASLSAENLPGLTLKEALKTDTFWFLAVAMLLIGVTNTGIQQHIVPCLTDMGYTSTFAANIMALYLAVGVLGKLLLGNIFDRWGIKAGMAYACTLLVATLVALAGGKIMVIAVLFAVLYGLSNPISTVPGPFITANLFGQKDYGVVYGVISIAMTLGMGIGMPLSGAIYDAKGTYLPAWFLYMGLAAIILILSVIAVRKEKRLLEAEAQV